MNQYMERKSKTTHEQLEEAYGETDELREALKVWFDRYVHAEVTMERAIYSLRPAHKAILELKEILK